MKNKKDSKFSSRNRLALTVSAQVTASVLAALCISQFLAYIFPLELDFPPIISLIILSLIIGLFVAGFLSKWLFNPIKKLCSAMERVADGDFKIRLKTNSSSREIQELYSGFNLMTRELDSTEILQSDFVSNVSHEFKTPIGAIEGYAMLLQDCDNLTDEQKEYVEKINFNTKRLSSLAGNILLLSKFENQTINTQKSEFSLDEQIRQSIVMLEPDWGKKNIEFDAEMDSVKYTGNESMLRHVWDNLIGNAIKFDPVGGMVKIRLAEENGQIRFTIEDNGPGISPEAQKHIFDKFYQADSSHKEEGNGLGLALVKRILSIDGGEIFAENIDGGGCRFTVILKK